jgi:hypothetical protein
MISPDRLGNLCRNILDREESQHIEDPVRLGSIFREYTDMQHTPSIVETLKMVKSFGIKPEAVDYLRSGGTSMSAKGTWYIHYSSKDKPATQKFTIFHELFEIMQRTFGELDSQRTILKEPQLSRSADRFAAAALIPPQFFSGQASATGCDLVKLARSLELSHQCLLIALGQHFTELPFVGALYENSHDGSKAGNLNLEDFVASVVVKTARATRIKKLCGLQPVPSRNGHPESGSLVCAAVTGRHAVLWRSTHIEDSPAILVRPLLSSGREPYRVIFLALPNEDFSMISAQTDLIEPIAVNSDVSCPYEKKCHNSSSCIWRSRGGLDEFGL